MLDAVRAGDATLEVANLLISHGYPVAGQTVTSGDGKTWPLLAYVLLAWGEAIAAGQTTHTQSGASAILARSGSGGVDEDAIVAGLDPQGKRFFDAVGLLCRHGADPALVSNGTTPLYLAAVTRNRAGVLALAAALAKQQQQQQKQQQQRGGSFRVAAEVNRFLPSSSKALTTAVHAVASLGSDVPMMALLHALGGDVDAPQVPLVCKRYERLFVSTRGYSHSLSHRPKPICSSRSCMVLPWRLALGAWQVQLADDYTVQTSLPPLHLALMKVPEAGDGEDKHATKKLTADSTLRCWRPCNHSPASCWLGLDLTRAFACDVVLARSFCVRVLRCSVVFARYGAVFAGAGGERERTTHRSLAAVGAHQEAGDHAHL